MAGGLGFEPRLDESESSVLPLDDPPLLPLNIPHPRQKNKQNYAAVLICKSLGAAGVDVHPAGRAEQIIAKAV